MNQHILSPLERKRIIAFLNDKQETPPIQNIRSRARKNLPRLMKDMFLVARFLEKKELADYIGPQIDWEEE